MTNQQKRGALVVEATSHLARTFSEALARDDIVCEVMLAHGRVEAMDYLLGRGAYAGRDVHLQPCVTLLDLSLPDSDGPRLLRDMRAHERTRLLPLVAFSTAEGEQQADAGYVSGANSYIDIRPGFKPFEKSLQQIARYWCVLNDPPPPV